jgi:uncharacterized damage-inducible protein DinB
VDPASLQSMLRFNTWANENLRQALVSSDEAQLRKPLEDFWFGSVFSILTHVLGGETTWLARLRDGEAAPRPPNADEFSPKTLAEAWRKKDQEWEEWAAAVTPEQLATRGTWRRADGKLYELQHWQVATHIVVHSTNHRGHATVAMTALGIRHGPQDFLDQYRPLE